MKASQSCRLSTLLDEIDDHNNEKNIYVHFNKNNHDELVRKYQAAMAGRGGLPPFIVSVKDNIDVAAYCTGSGLPIESNQAAATEDAPIITRLRNGGGLVVGKTNMNPLALGVTTRNPFFGDCINPRYEHLIPGGSSGGAAASVANGWADIALGTDTMGSVRIPAHCCGVIGFKPSFGFISSIGVSPLCKSFDTVGLVSADINLIRYVYLLMRGFDPADPYSRSVYDLQTDDARVRIGAPMNLEQWQCDPTVAGYFMKTTKDLAAMGFNIATYDDTCPELEDIRVAAFKKCEIELLNSFNDGVFSFDKELIPADISQGMRWASGRSAIDLVGIDNVISNGKLTWRAIARHGEFVALPTLPCRIPRKDAAPPNNLSMLTTLANVVGVPALTIPTKANHFGEPFSLQLIGPVGSDLALLDLGARILERWR